MNPRFRWLSIGPDDAAPSETTGLHPCGGRGSRRATGGRNTPPRLSRFLTAPGRPAARD